MGLLAEPSFVTIGLLRKAAGVWRNIYDNKSEMRTRKENWNRSVKKTKAPQRKEETVIKNRKSLSAFSRLFLLGFYKSLFFIEYVLF